MRTTIEISEPIYRLSEQAARKMGFSVEEFILRAVEHELATETPAKKESVNIRFPVVASQNPGTLDLTDFNFDDLLT
jgi:hypothetical protein